MGTFNFSILEKTKDSVCPVFEHGHQHLEVFTILDTQPVFQCFLCSRCCCLS